MRRVLISALLLAGFAWSQNFNDKPPVIVAPVGTVQVRAGGSKDVPLDFRVESDFHINSHTPKSPLLIPTVLKFRPGKEIPPDGSPTCISPAIPGNKTPECVQAVAAPNTKYPSGVDMSFAFSPNEKLSVYSGDFSIVTVLKTQRNTPPGTYPMIGELRFQACDRSACYPPRSIPVQFQVTVVK